MRIFGEGEVISRGVAQACVACVPLGILGSFLWPSGGDIATAVLVVVGIVVLLQAPGLAAKAPMGLAGLWIAFVLFAAVYASAWGAPGRSFGGLGKHLPIALGPPAAVALSAASHRLRFGFDRLVTLFLAGLVAGALAMLIRNGALDVLAHGWLQSSEGMLGKINRNYAALTCGLSLIAVAALIALASAAGHMRVVRRISVMAALALVFVGVGILLVVLQSRTAYAATAVGLAVWCGLMMHSSLRGAGGRRGLAIPAVIAVVAVAGAAPYFSLIGDRLSAGGSTAVYLREIAALMRGGAIDASSMSVSGAERLQLVAFALDLIRQRPWLGWGPDALSLIALLSPYPDIRHLNQFHNGYLQALVSFGITGGILSVALVAALLWSAVQRRRATSPDRLASPLFAAMVALMAHILVTNVAESTVFVKPMGAICMFLAALACMRDRATVEDVIGRVAERQRLET